MVYGWLGSISCLLLVGLMCGFMMPGQPGFNAMFPGVAKLMAEAKGESSATKVKAGTSNKRSSGRAGGGRRRQLIEGGPDTNLGRKTLMGG
jgi:hypothetical protein